MGVMANDPPALAMFVFTAVFAFGAYLYICHAERMKHWKETYALFEFQRRASRTYSVQSYRTIGWIFAVCAVLMLTVSVILLFA